MRILTYNLLGFSDDRPDDTDRRLALTIKALREQNIDIALLQEVGSRYDVNGRAFYCAESRILECPDYQDGSRFVYGEEDAREREGVAILSKYQITGERYGHLPKGLFGRSYVLLQLDVSGFSLNVMTFHLEPPAIGKIVFKHGAVAEQQRQVQNRQLNEIASVIGSLDPRTPLVVGGDFNLEGNDELFRDWKRQLGIREIFPDSPQQPRKTFATHRSPSFECGLAYRFDHLCYRDGDSLGLRVIDEGVALNGPVADPSELFYGFLSDHTAVFAEMEFDSVRPDSTWETA